jgi:hypothetical protein
MAELGDRAEAQVAVANFLLERIRQDHYPSETHMTMLEQFIPRAMARQYVNVLLEKVVADSFPSTSMLRRLLRIVDEMA